MLTVSWLSAAVEKICDFFVGITVLREMRVDITPPTVSMPRLRGLTSNRTMELSPQSPPDRMQAWTAAPYATASSGLTPLEGSLPLKNSLTSCWTLGMRVDPPTRIISSMSFFCMSASSRTFLTGTRVDLNKSMLSSSNLARVRVSEKSAPSNRDSISSLAWWPALRVLFAFSTSRLSFCTARSSVRRSLPVFFLNTLMKCSMTLWSKSSPPRWVSPLVAITSKTPSAMVRSDTSKVPPPRSKTRMFFSPDDLSFNP